MKKFKIRNEPQYCQSTVYRYCQSNGQSTGNEYCQWNVTKITKKQRWEEWERLEGTIPYPSLIFFFVPEVLKLQVC